MFSKYSPNNIGVAVVGIVAHALVGVEVAAVANDDAFVVRGVAVVLDARSENIYIISTKNMKKHTKI